MHNLVVTPDLLYGCTSTCNISGIIDQSSISEDMLTGILPQHLYNYIVSSNESENSKYSIFNGCFILPNYIGTYIKKEGDEIKLKYHIYTFIPENFTNSNMVLLNGMFKFHIFLPQQTTNIGSMPVTYDFYVLFTSNSFKSNI